MTWVKAAPGMRRKQRDRRRIVLLPVTVEDIPQHEHQGGQRHERNGWPWAVWVPVVVPIPTHHICLTGSCLPGALAGFFCGAPGVAGDELGDWASTIGRPPRHP